MYLVASSWLLRIFYPQFVWNIPTEEKNIYLTFDDGPHETATPFVLNELKKYNAKATFFCIGKNVEEHPDIFRQIIHAGHSVGNHTFNHLNGWKTKDDIYVEDILKADELIHSNLFRPPYGRMRKRQWAKGKRQKAKGKTQNSKLKTVIMWSVLSGDFDIHLSPEKCLENVIRFAKSGSIIVFHDSAKAFERMSFALPKTLEYFTNKGYNFKAIKNNF
jgi:peptidoglycan/xylan/chitin deacetylase (PgdA/CDA1 family)